MLLLQRSACRSRSIGRVCKHLETGGLVLHELNAGWAVGSIGGGDFDSGDDPRIRLGDEMRLEAVGAHRRRLVAVPGLGVDRRDHPVPGDCTCDAPASWLFARFDVLARDQGEQPDRLLRLGGVRRTLHCSKHCLRVMHQPAHERTAGGCIRPIDHRLAALVTRRRQRDERSLGHDPAHLSDRADELGNGVLRGHGVVEDARVECPAVLAHEHAGCLNDRADRVEDALRALRLPELGPPVREVREVEARVVERQPAGNLPVDARTQCADRVAVGEPFERLQHHH